jgi:feruloyl esterase
MLGAPCGLFAADCASLKNLQLEDTAISMAETVSSGTLDLGEAGTFQKLPVFCRVAGELHPTSDSRIRFEVWLPELGSGSGSGQNSEQGSEGGWNGRLLGVGNGGFAGSIYYRQMAGYLKRGFAVAGSDAGHEAEAGDASWAWQHPEKVKDFGWRAVHLTAERAKQMVEAYYGKAADRSYFDGCSDGGREALMEAQRFPEDYDGILAGAPANAWSTMVASGGVAMQALMADPRSYIPDGKLKLIERAALTACDALDGVKDGVIGDPGKCRFDPEVLLCKGGEGEDCLTQPQIDALKVLYGGSRDARGGLIFPGFSMGDESGWKEWVIGEAPGASYSYGYVQNYFRYMVTGDATFNVLTAKGDDLLRESRAKEAADLDATDADLSRFAARGGKLILYHGWNDAAISPANTIAYFEGVEKQMGEEKVASFARLYMVPGMEHCTGGPGASAMGQLGIPTAKGPKFGVFDSLENWVEKGSPEEGVVATKFATGKAGGMETVFTRPLCAWPKVARYSGSGDATDAANFACVAP